MLDIVIFCCFYQNITKKIANVNKLAIESFSQEVIASAAKRPKQSPK